MTLRIHKDPVGFIGLSQELRLPIRWLREQAYAGSIPCLKVGDNRRLFNVEAVRDALAELATKPSIPRKPTVLRAGK